jgi:hypothetical protein
LVFFSSSECFAVVPESKRVLLEELQRCVWRKDGRAMKVDQSCSENHGKLRSDSVSDKKPQNSVETRLRKHESSDKIDQTNAPKRQKLAKTRQIDEQASNSKLPRTSEDSRKTSRAHEKSSCIKEESTERENLQDVREAPGDFQETPDELQASQEPPHNPYEPPTTSPHPDYVMIEEEVYDADYIIEEDLEDIELLTKHSNLFRNTKEHLEWANKLTKLNYSIVKAEDGAEVPTWSCSLCFRPYKSSQALRLHLLAKHLEEEVVGLTDEVKEWLRKVNREQRTQIETEDGNKFEWNCGFCNDFTCYASKTFRVHLLANHMDNCGRAEGVVGNLQNSETTIEVVKSTRPRKPRSSSVQWICGICHFQFSAQRNFTAHMRLHDTLNNVSPFTELFRCEDCRMFFRNVDDLAVHVEAHAEGDSLLVPAKGIALQKTILFKRLPFPEDDNEACETCGHCGQRILGEVTCKSHLLLHHVNPICCPKDDRQFTSMQPFICHLQKVHADILPESLRCTHCQLSFDNIYDRLAHMKLCDQKKLACDHCDKKFSNKNHLNTHLKRELGLLSCKCQVCGKVVKAKDELKIHMRSHTREKPFKCSICDKSYT